MRVLHYISGISPTIGGIEMFLLNVQKELTEKNYKIEILTRYVDENTEMYKLIRNSGIKVHTLETQHLSLTNIFNFKKKVKLFFNKANQFDILHSHNFEDPYIVKYAKKSNVRSVILHVHSYKSSKRSFNGVIKRLIENINCRNANYFLSSSPEVGRSSYPLKYKSKIIPIINGIDTKKFEYNPAIRKKNRVALGLENKFVVCHVGRFSEVKNHSFLIDIFNNIQSKQSEARLLLIGDGELKKDTYKKCKDLNIADKVIFTGDQSNTNELLQAADVFVLPSLNEGFGIVIVEAQASGLPTIVAKEGVSKTVKVSELVEFISLEESILNWSNLILSYSGGYKREKMSEVIEAAGYDNKSTANKLANIYNQIQVIKVN